MSVERIEATPWVHQGRHGPRSADPHYRNRWPRWTGIAVGVAIATSFLAAGRVPSGSGDLGADVRITTMADPRLDLSPVGLVLSAAGLTPGGETTGAHSSLEVTNVTGVALRIRLGARIRRTELAGILWLDVRQPGAAAPIFRGPVARLGAIGSSALTLRPGRPADLLFTAWLPASVSSDFEAKQGDIQLQWNEAPA